MLKFDIIPNLKGAHTYTLAMNEFGDLLGHEFSANMKGFRARPEEKVSDLLSANTGSLPASVDWVKEGAVTPVSEGYCGRSLASAVTGALEAAHQIKTKKLVRLSEQQLLDCVPKVRDGCD